MAQTVSAAFAAAQAANVNAPDALVYLVLGNYANSASYAATAASSSDASADYPAAGAINGDRTEINVGPAAGADNGIGKSSWKSGGVPDAGDVVWLDVYFGQTRTINRLKVYHLEGHGLTSYSISYWDGAAWVVFAATIDICGGGGGGFGYGEGPYGDTPYGGSSSGGGGGTCFTTDSDLDVIDFPDVSTDRIRINAFSTEVAMEQAQLVEVEVYRKVDITSRVLDTGTSRDRDYNLQNPLAASFDLACANTDRFFSRDYTPTAAEVTAGFVNSELDTDLQVLVKLGFAGEEVNEIVGIIDKIGVRSADRQAYISGRDTMKVVNNQILSTKLKTSIDIGAAVVYVLNLCNISNYEMDVDTTSILLDYFFLYNTSGQTAIQRLSQACGDAQFFFDENGIATFKMYLNNVPQSRIVSTQADFAAASVLTSIDTNGLPGAIRGPWILLDDFADGNYTTNPVWTATSNAGPSSSFNIVATALEFDIGGLNSRGSIETPFAQSTGTYRFSVNFVSRTGVASSNPNDGITVLFMGTAASTASSQVTGYGLHFCLNLDGSNNGIQLKKFSNDFTTNGTVLATVSTSLPSGPHTYTVTRTAGGLMTVYQDGVSIGSATDATLGPCVNFGMAGYTTGSFSSFVFQIDNIYYTPLLTGLDGVYESQVFDQGATILSEGIFQATVLTASGTIAFYTATSPDGFAFDPYVAVAIDGAIASTTRRYIKVKAVLHTTLTNLDPSIPTVYDYTINWTTGAGSAKYHASIDFTFQDTDLLLGLDTEITDNLSGESAIFNKVQVSASPLVLTGTAADTQWQGTNGTPPASISVTNPLTVGIGTVDYQAVIPAGMNTALMSGANPAAAVVTFGTAIGTWTFALIHPTRPILRLAITTAGTITDLRIVGQAFASLQTPLYAEASDSASIGRHSARTLPIDNSFIVNTGIAQAIANRLVSDGAEAVVYIPTATVRPTWSMQLGDRVKIVDANTATNADYIPIGIRQRFVPGSTIQTETKMVRIP